MTAANPTAPAGDGRNLARRVVDIDTPTALQQLLRDATNMQGWRLRHLDLRPFAAELARLDPSGALVLGCTLEPDLLGYLEAGGALVYPDVPDAPIDEFRSTLYSPDELYAGLGDAGYSATPDARAYGWSHRLAEDGSDAAGIVARALHDASIDAALTIAIAELARPVVGVMGGHAVARGSDDYRRAVELGWQLSRAGAVVATGGGPGAMEAANLGAYLADHDRDVLDEARALLAAAPSFTPSINAWAKAAFEVRRRWPDGAASIGVPTWFYGHEPPNAFASAIAKFFQNSVREATLIERCNGGIVFLPGAAGTVQEIFQDACENYYAAAGAAVPMVLVGSEHWTTTVPVHPLLTALAEQGGFADRVILVDKIVDAVAAVAIHRE